MKNLVEDFYVVRHQRLLITFKCCGNFRDHLWPINFVPIPSSQHAARTQISQRDGSSLQILLRSRETLQTD